MTNIIGTFFSTSYIICFATLYLFLLITLSYACYRLGYNRSSSFYRRRYRLIRKDKSSTVNHNNSSQDESLPLMSEQMGEEEKSKELKARMMKSKLERQKEKVRQEEKFKNFEPLYGPKTCSKCSQKVNSKKEARLSNKSRDNESTSLIEFDRKYVPTNETLVKEDEGSTVLNFETDNVDTSDVTGTRQSIQTVHPVITKIEPCFVHQQTTVVSEESPAVISIDHTQKIPKTDHQYVSKSNSKQSGQDNILNNELEIVASEDEMKERQASENQSVTTSNDLDNTYIAKDSYSQISKTSHSRGYSLQQSKDKLKSKDIILNWPTIKAKEQPIPITPHVRLPETNARSPPKVAQLKRSLIATRVKREINKPITEEKEPFEIIDERIIQNEMTSKVMSTSIPGEEGNLQIKGMIILNKGSRKMNKSECPFE